jgi:hypothetical protein
MTTEPSVLHEPSTMILFAQAGEAGQVSGPPPLSDEGVPAETADGGAAGGGTAAAPADGFLFVYDGGFNPEEPTDGCLFGNDDDGGIRGSALRNIPVRAGGTITVVASTFSTAGFTGAFSITVTAR